MSESKSELTPDDWAIIRDTAASSGLIVLRTNELPVDGRLPMTGAIRQQLADAVARAAIGHYHRESFEAARKYCRAALLLEREWVPALACELALLRRAGRRKPADDVNDVDGQHCDPFVVALSYGVEAEATAAKIWERNRNQGSESREQMVTVGTLLAGYFYWRALTKYPDTSAPWTNLAAVLSELGSAIGALEIRERALAINPGDIHAQYNTALYCWRSGRLADALTRMRAAADRGHGEARKTIADLQNDLLKAQAGLAASRTKIERGVGLFAVGRYGEALEPFGYGLAAALDPGLSFYVGQSLRILGRFEEASRVFLGAGTDGENWGARLWAAVCYKQSGRLDLALSLAETVAREDPLILDAKYLRADVYRQQRDSIGEEASVRALFMIDRILNG